MVASQLKRHVAEQGLMIPKLCIWVAAAKLDNPKEGGHQMQRLRWLRDGQSSMSQSTARISKALWAAFLNHLTRQIDPHKSKH